jgi:hypothetical protein
VAGSCSLACRRGMGMETTGSGGTVQTSDRNMLVLACVSSPGSGGVDYGGGIVGVMKAHGPGEVMSLSPRHQQPPLDRTAPPPGT